MLSEGVASVPGLMNGLANTFSEDAALAPKVSPLEGPCDPPPEESLLELLPGCENEPLAMLCMPDRSAPSAKHLRSATLTGWADVEGESCIIQAA